MKFCLRLRVFASENRDQSFDRRTQRLEDSPKIITMFPSRKLLTILPRRTFTTTTLPRLSLTISRTPAPTHLFPSRQSPLAHHRSLKCHHQFRQLSSETSETQTKKIPKYIQPGDWLCGGCQAHNFRTRMLCFECQSPNSEGRVFYVQGSWNCPTCNLYVPRKALSLFHCFCVSLSSILCSVVLCFKYYISRNRDLCFENSALVLGDRDSVLFSRSVCYLSLDFYFMNHELSCSWTTFLSNCKLIQNTPINVNAA